MTHRESVAPLDGSTERQTIAVEDRVSRRNAMTNSLKTVPGQDVTKVAVIGAGLMGHGIALEFASAGIDVAINDQNAELLQSAMARARSGLELLAEAGRIGPGDVESALLRITPVPVIEDAAANADVVIEAVFEDLQLKQDIFRRLDKAAPERTVLLSNTSTYLPSALAASTSRPDRVAVAHYFNPPHLLPIVELVRGPETSDQTIETARDLLTRVGKRPALVNREILGFIGNRLQAALFREALALVEQGVASAEDVDAVVKYGFGRRLSVAGPFEVWEQIGWDLVATIKSELFPDIDRSTTVPKILSDMVARGELGTKTGKGFYDWTPESAEALRLRISQALLNMPPPE